MDCFQILPDLSVKNGADFIPCLILLCGGAGWGKGKREKEPVKPGVLGLAGPVGLDLSRNQARCLLRTPVAGDKGFQRAQPRACLWWACLGSLVFGNGVS